MKNPQRKRNGMDERQKQINFKAISVGWGVLVICLCGEIIYKTLKEMNCAFEWIVLFASFLAVSVSRRIFGDIQCPRGFTGKPLPTGYAKADKKKRRVNYLLESLVFSGILTLILSLAIAFGTDTSGTLIIEIFSFGGTYHAISVFILCAVAFFILVTGIGFWACYMEKEQKLTEYNRICAELEG